MGWLVVLCRGVVWGGFVIWGRLMIGFRGVVWGWILVWGWFLVWCGGRFMVWGRFWGIALPCTTVDVVLVVTGSEVLVKDGPVAAVKNVLLPILVTEVVNLTVGLWVSIMPAWIRFGPAVKVGVGLGHRDGKRLDRLHLVRTLLQKHWACWRNVGRFGRSIRFRRVGMCWGAVGWFRGVGGSGRVVGWFRNVSRDVGWFRNVGIGDIGGFRDIDWFRDIGRLMDVGWLGRRIRLRGVVGFQFEWRGKT